MHNSIHGILWKWQKYKERESSICQELGIRGGYDYKGFKGRFLRGTVLYLDCGGGYINLYICYNS